MFIIPTYFQVTQNVSTAKAGAFLIPSIAGNTVGGLVTGAWIKKYIHFFLPVLARLSKRFLITNIIGIDMRNTKCQ